MCVYIYNEDTETYNEDTKTQDAVTTMYNLGKKTVLRKKDSGFSHKDSGCRGKVSHHFDGLLTRQIDGSPSPRLEWATTPE
jgi:hypothetical protein